MRIKVRGKEMNFSQEELRSILEDYFELKTFQSNMIFEVTVKPSEGRWFIVEPKKIIREIFLKKRNNPEQENVRQLILIALDEVEKDPNKYGHKFKTMFPFRYWQRNRGKQIRDLDGMAKIIGDHMADEIEQYLEWAQRIQNGESWEELCNMQDVAPSYRVIKTQENPYLHRIVGGARDRDAFASPTCMNDEKYTHYEKVGCTVPLIVSYHVP